MFPTKIVIILNNTIVYKKIMKKKNESTNLLPFFLCLLNYLLLDYETSEVWKGLEPLCKIKPCHSATIPIYYLLKCFFNINSSVLINYFLNNLYVYSVLNRFSWKSIIFCKFQNTFFDLTWKTNFHMCKFFTMFTWC